MPEDDPTKPTGETAEVPNENAELATVIVFSATAEVIPGGAS